MRLLQMLAAKNRYPALMLKPDHESPLILKTWGGAMCSLYQLTQHPFDKLTNAFSLQFYRKTHGLYNYSPQ